jgi:hypothetical protein
VTSEASTEQCDHQKILVAPASPENTAQNPKASTTTDITSPSIVLIDDLDNRHELTIPLQAKQHGPASASTIGSRHRSSLDSTSSNHTRSRRMTRRSSFPTTIYETAGWIKGEGSMASKVLRFTGFLLLCGCILTSVGLNIAAFSASEENDQELYRNIAEAFDVELTLISIASILTLLLTTREERPTTPYHSSAISGHHRVMAPTYAARQSFYMAYERIEGAGSLTSKACRITTFFIISGGMIMTTGFNISSFTAMDGQQELYRNIASFGASTLSHIGWYSAIVWLLQFHSSASEEVSVDRNQNEKPRASNCSSEDAEFIIVPRRPR